MQDHLPPAAQEKYAEIEELQDEAEQVVIEKQRLSDRVDQSQAALDALSEAEPDADVYRSIGSIRFPTDHDAAESSLEATIDAAETRIETLDEKEQRLQEQFAHRKEEIKHLLGAGGSTSPGTGDQQ